ncbi:hypothetical protein FK220_017350 [Flavobacteriaceae bacterium TP-CH-4]|uniref:SGNH hydrolase-type esterase domain-containing protein n=1 Tax=Pelagihabitans pacificus TaxID=2696054 RepID=A0A967B102_9FLAO|nr:GDSL-type esterase/lipase family protein [Pelagihabitans pacificus]NHF61122.1 hypothetical protein [Pelagihabitans pacificus]
MKKLWLPLSLLGNVLLALYVFLSGNFFTKDAFPEKKHIEIPTADEEVVDEKGLTVEPVNIVMLGNSITYQGDWQQVLGRNDVFNGGKPGWTTQQLSWVIKNFIVPHRPKICFFKGGINDYTLGISTQRIYENITMVMDSISSIGTSPVYTTTLYQRGVTERNREIDTLNARMKEFCRERGYDYMDLRPFLCENGDIKTQYVQEDNTHLKPAAYPQWARAMQPMLEKYGLN